eukprot:gene15209-gene16082
MIRELGSDFRFPFVPADKRKAPIEAAMPKQTVLTSQGTYCMASKMASPACTDPPGLLMYKVMSAVGSSAARYSICDTITLATSSLTSLPKSSIRSCSNREN